MIKCLAVDDEKLALDLLVDNIKQVPFLELVKRCKNPLEAAELLKIEKIDLIFLDIQMPGINGIQFLQTMENRPMVILITAFKQYALEGFNLDVLDYLVKPVSFPRFLKAANKALDYYNLTNKQPTKPETTVDYFFVNSEYSLVKIMKSEIAYIEGQKDYIEIHFINDAKSVVTRMNFKEIEDKLAGGKFIRVHKSYIVAIEKINSIRANIITIGESKIPVGDSYRTEFLQITNPEGAKG